MKLSLAIDNCFAMKRWTDPKDWMEIVNGLGLHFVEASADNEIDPLYSTDAYRQWWLNEVKAASDKYKVRVQNLYSGHGTYSTLGLAHTDPSVRQHIKDNWIKAMIRFASELGAGLGFYTHAFSESVLDNPIFYAEAFGNLVDDLQEISAYANTLKLPYLSVEQMYSPHQVPWTIEGTLEFLRKINDAKNDSGIYITLDTGHQSGQARFAHPSEEAVKCFISAAKKGDYYPIHLGTRRNYSYFWEKAHEGAAFGELLDEFTEHAQKRPYLFCDMRDSNPYAWLENLACFSPIIHLQQTNGKASSHKAFTAANNADGIISPAKVFKAIHSSCQREEMHELKKVSHAYLTLEIFLPTACDTRAALDEIAESVRFWRQYIPEDNMEIEEIIEHFDTLSKS